MVIGFAASPGEPALDGEPDGNSPYAAALLKHFAAGGYSFGDLMTMVSEEVYLKTKARQLPWINSSLRRVLSFGTPVEATSGDDAAIRDGRRQLLLTIASEPDATKKYVEGCRRHRRRAARRALRHAEGAGGRSVVGRRRSRNAAPAGGGKLKTLPGREAGRGQDRHSSWCGWRTLPTRRRPRAPSIWRSSSAPRRSKRADEMSANLDVTEANLKSDRIQLGATYAEHARTAELNFDFATAAQMWGKAYDQVAKWDAAAALTDKLNEAAAYLADGRAKGDAATLQTAVATYGDAEQLTKTGSDEWASAHLALGGAYDVLGQLKQDSKLLQHAADTEADVGQYYNNSGAPSEQAVGAFLRAYGTAMMHLSEVEQSVDVLDQAAGSLLQAVDHTDRKTLPLDWAAAKSNLGTVLQVLGGAQPRSGDAQGRDHCARRGARGAEPRQRPARMGANPDRARRVAGGPGADRQAGRQCRQSQCGDRRVQRRAQGTDPGARRRMTGLRRRAASAWRLRRAASPPRTTMTSNRPWSR